MNTKVGGMVAIWLKFSRTSVAGLYVRVTTVQATLNGKL